MQRGQHRENGAENRHDRSDLVNSPADWRPDADHRTLQRRAAMLAAAREFFGQRNVMEVETPLLCANSVTDPHIESIAVTQGAAAYWLRTSPEYHMKRLLAAGSGDIFQIGKAFRAGEAGNRHQPEFTMIEWYRHDFGLDQMIAETCQLIMSLSAHCESPIKDCERVSYRDVFFNTIKLDPFNASTTELKNFCLASKQTGCDEALAEGLGSYRPGWLDLIAGTVVYPALSGGKLWVVDNYPADQALLARLDPEDPAIAERFEVFLNGLELANGFHELSDAKEQRHRFDADRRHRKTAELPDMTIDMHLISALESGLPDCSGVAVGLDRVMMAAGNYTRISETMSFLPAR